MINYELLQPILKQVKTGAFLTTKLGNQINTMTIGWMTIGQVWNEDVITVYVRFSRHTYDLIQNSDCFTVSFPYPKSKLDKIKEWGERSGRDYDKLTMKDVSATKNIDGVRVNDCNIHIECKKIYNQIMDPKYLDKSLHKDFYGDVGDYHHIYYGKIVDMYAEEKLELFPGK